MTACVIWDLCLNIYWYTKNIRCPTTTRIVGTSVHSGLTQRPIGSKFPLLTNLKMTQTSIVSKGHHTKTTTYILELFELLWPHTCVKPSPMAHLTRPINFGGNFLE